MAKPKLYNSLPWLKRAYQVDRKSIDQIADECGVSHNTIRTALKKGNLLR